MRAASWSDCQLLQMVTHMGCDWGWLAPQETKGWERTGQGWGSGEELSIVRARLHFKGSLGCA